MTAIKALTAIHARRSTQVFLGWVISLLASMAALAKTPKALDARLGSQIKFDYHSHDFGSVYRGTEQRHKFRFVNVGKGPLTIQGVHAACGCTAIELEQSRVYAPGESGFVEVKFDTTDFAGPVAKAVTVMSNERQMPDRTLTIKAFVKSELEASPPLADFGEVFSKEGASTQIRLKALQGFELKVRDLVYSKQTLDVTSSKDGDDILLHIKLRADLPPGFVKETILIKNNSRFLGELPVPVRATVKGNIDFSPAYLEFGAISPSESSRRQVSMQGVQAFEITGTRADFLINGRKVERPERFLKVDSTLQNKGQQLVGVELVHGAQLSGSVHGKLFLITSDPGQKEVAVDFYAFFR